MGDKQRRASTREVVRVVSQLTEQLRKVMGVIVVVCTAFGLSVSEAKNEIMFLRTKGMPESTAIFSAETAGQEYNQTNEFVYLGGNVNHNADLSMRSTGAYTMHGAASGSTPSNCTTYRVLPLSSKSGSLEPRYSRQCCTAASRGARARATTTCCTELTTAS